MNDNSSSVLRRILTLNEYTQGWILNREGIEIKRKVCSYLSNWKWYMKSLQDTLTNSIVSNSKELKRSVL